jgi:hypothetical protein
MALPGQQFTVTLDPSAVPFVAATGMLVTGNTSSGEKQTVRVLPGATVGPFYADASATLVFDPTGYSPQYVTIPACPTPIKCYAYPYPCDQVACANCECAGATVPVASPDGQWNLTALCSGSSSFNAMLGTCPSLVWSPSLTLQVVLTPTGTSVAPQDSRGRGGMSMSSHAPMTPWGTLRHGTKTA